MRCTRLLDAGLAVLAVATLVAACRPHRQRRDVTARTSWRSAGSLDRHFFGLGDAREADRIRVVWPSGAVDTIPGPIPANQRVRIAEGRGTRPR